MKYLLIILFISLPLFAQTKIKDTPVNKDSLELAQLEDGLFHNEEAITQTQSQLYTLEKSLNNLYKDHGFFLDVIKMKKEAMKNKKK